MVSTVRLRLILIGRDKNEPLIEVADEYSRRINRYTSFEVVELKETPLKSQANVDQVRSDEAKKIRKALKPGEHVIALDERGQSLSSVQVAESLDRWSSHGPTSVAFVIGGPAGLDRDFLATANGRWQLSKMTLPHRMARLILTEQIYRAFTILRNEPYHK